MQKYRPSLLCLCPDCAISRVSTSTKCSCVQYLIAALHLLSCVKLRKAVIILIHLKLFIAVILFIQDWSQVYRHGSIVFRVLFFSIKSAKLEECFPLASCKFSPIAYFFLTFLTQQIYFFFSKKGIARCVTKEIPCALV